MDTIETTVLVSNLAGTLLRRPMRQFTVSLFSFHVLSIVGFGLCLGLEDTGIKQPHTQCQSNGGNGECNTESISRAFIGQIKAAAWIMEGMEALATHVGVGSPKKSIRSR
jgi:hypothetical protein